MSLTEFLSFAEQRKMELQTAMEVSVWWGGGGGGGGERQSERERQTEKE